MRPSSDTERTQVPTRTNSTEHLDTLTEKKTNMSSPVEDPELAQTFNTRQQYDDTFDGNEVIEGSSGDDTDVEKGDQTNDERAQQLKKKESKHRDPNLIEWDGPNDPENPMNWPTSKKWRVTIAMGMMTFCVTFASSVFSNATVPTAKLFGVSTEVTTLGTSLFVAGFGAGPLVSFPLARFLDITC
jgi:MFS transporter, DHA1 family, multidrug resistance protein